jgi:SAM-dependent methyltransferase
MGHVAEYRASTYGDRIADFYDNLAGTMFQPAATEQAAGFLADLAGTGPALELGIGTGRIAIPLAERGVAVTGVDASEAMVARLRARPGGATIPVVMGDFGELAVEGQFELIYVVFNTFFALLTQQLQVQCFRRVAERLTASGVFVTEAFVPDPTRYERGQAVSAEHITQDWVMLNAARHDPTTQTDQHAPRSDRRAGRAAVPGRASLRLAERAGPDGGAGRLAFEGAVWRLGA